LDSQAYCLLVQVVKHPFMDVPLAFSDTEKQKFVFLTLPAAARIIIEIILQE